jgi:hypothetical protein
LVTLRLGSPLTILLLLWLLGQSTDDTAAATPAAPKPVVLVALLSDPKRLQPWKCRSGSEMLLAPKQL